MRSLVEKDDLEKSSRNWVKPRTKNKKQKERTITKVSTLP